MVVQEQHPGKPIIRVSDCPGYVEDKQQRTAAPVNLAECREYFENNLSVQGKDSHDLGQLGNNENPTPVKESFKEGEDHAFVDEPGKAIKQGKNGEERYEAHINKGYNESRQGNHVGAIEEYTQAINIFQDRAYAYYTRGHSKYLLGQLDEAIDDYTQAINLDPKYADVYNARGVAKKDLGQHDEAINDLTQAIKLDPEHAFAYNNRGIAKYFLGQLDEAIDDYTQAIKLDPEYVYAYYNRGIAKEVLGQLEEAIDDYTQAIKLDPELEVAYNNREVAKSQLGQQEDGFDNLDQEYKEYPELAAEYIERGNAKLNEKDYSGAINEYNEAMDKGRPEAYNDRGFVKSKLGQLEEAIDDYTLAISKDPKYAEAYVKRGDTKMEMGDSKGAIKDFDKAASEMNPGEEQNIVYIKMRLAKSGQRQQENGFDVYDQEFKEYPELAAEYIERGNVKLNEKDYSGAINEYNEAMERNPSSAEEYEIVVNRGFAKSGQGELDHALEDYDQAIDIYSDIATAYIKRGHVKFTKGDYTGADEDYERAMNSNPFEGERYEIHLYRGRIELKEGRTRQAIGNFNLAIEMDEGRPEAYNDRGLARLIMFEDERNNDVELKWEINADFTAAIKAATAGGLDQEQYVAEAYYGYNNRGKLKLRVSPDRMDDAIDDFDLAIELDDTRPEAYINRGDAMLLRDDPAAAINDYGQAIATETEQVLIEGYLKRGKVYLIMRDHLSAIDNYGIVIDSDHALDNELIEALFSRGLAMSERGSYWDAIDDFDGAINQLKSAAGKQAQRRYISNIYLPLHYYRGIARLELGQAGDALLDFGRAKTEYYEYERETSQTANGDESHVRVQLPDILTQEGHAYNKLDKIKESGAAFAQAEKLKEDSGALKEGSDALEEGSDISITDYLSTFAYDVWFYFPE